MDVTYDAFATARLPALLRYALMLTGDPHTAADLVQDTMVKAQLNWRRVQSADQPERYVRRMLTNAYTDLRRGSWLRRVVLRADHAEPPPVADHAAATADRDVLWTLLGTLPRQQRAALVLRYYEGFDDVEIAAILRCGTGTVRGYVFRGLATLRTHLPDLCGEAIR
jgi:RNA polymerase sigma-70 factor (sigma-E family)